MLSEYLKDAHWQTVFTGIRMCQLKEYHAVDTYPRIFLLQSVPHRLELFFCCGGTLLFSQPGIPTLTVKEQEILLVSDACKYTGLQISSPVSGFFLSIDCSLSADTVKGFRDFFPSAADFPDDIYNMLRLQNGCNRIPNTIWGRSACAILHCLPFAEQGRYFALKAMELFYLLSEKNLLFQETDAFPPSYGYLARVVADVRTYMEQHLDEKLTISSLCQQFHLSATAFKSCFRSLYGQPVHSWLSSQRMKKATQLLHNSSLTVLQIAQAVGYEGISQFNVIFKREYGVTPSEYRKMSNIGNF